MPRTPESDIVPLNARLIGPAAAIVGALLVPEAVKLSSDAIQPIDAPIIAIGLIGLWGVIAQVYYHYRDSRQSGVDENYQDKPTG